MSVEVNISDIAYTVSGIETFSEKQYKEIREVSGDTYKLHSIDRNLNTIKLELFVIIILLIILSFFKFSKK